MPKELTLVSLGSLMFSNVNLPIERDGYYFELQLKRDKSSFAGVGFRVVRDNKKENKIIKSYNYEKEEYVLETRGKYEKILFGMEIDYLQSIEKVLSTTEKNYGLEVFFLVYSDVRSSPKVFEELMQSLDERISDLQ
ncbi:hypothetical protein [Cohnella fermenti]|uniref:Uncharacterized protein n=1 Tax=Cohnella fermenti TaxID=2565925 RepID=A0A4S4BJZ9_9BACL|nr:hypothetical protein [Cohnella fermenti]THF74059.1 hypothetical protein E6C55_26580 [Cohnella fermenti]